MKLFAKLIAVAAAPLLLTSCFLTPGKFTSELEIDADGSFAFTYEGEIFMMGLQSLAKAGAEAEQADFKGECFDDEGMERECSEEEREDQLEDKKRKDAQNLAMFGAMFGGIDPTSPDGIEEFVTRLKKQKGWQEVSHRGDGIFDVVYTIEGRLDRNFSFPELEKVQGITPFVVAIARKDGAIRIDAPGFAVEQEGASLGMLAAMSGMGDGKDAPDMGPIPVPDGEFRITTNAEILTNNTEEGPTVSGSNLRTLSWTINQRTKAAPEALIKLD